MKIKIAFVTIVTAVFSLLVWATPSSGTLFNNILNVGHTSDTLQSNVGGEAADGSKWHFQLKTEGAPTDVAVQDLAIAPGGYGGWHSHSGPVLITVKEGTMSLYGPDCVRHDYPAGTAFIIEGGAIHNERNESATENLRLLDTFFLPSGAPRRVEQAKPETCDLP